jgi:hypothetical protein
MSMTERSTGRGRERAEVAHPKLSDEPGKARLDEGELEGPSRRAAFLAILKSLPIARSTTHTPTGV